MSNARQKKIDEAIKELTNLYELGKDLIKSIGPVKAISKAQKDQIKKDHSVNDETILKSMKFVKEYTQSERDQLFQRIRQKQSSQKETVPVFGKTHLFRIFSIEKEKREEILDLALGNHWGLKTLEDEIKQRFGIRKKGGRKIRAPKTFSEFLNRLDSICEGWKRFKDGIYKAPAKGQGKHFSISDLRGTFKDAFEEVSAKILSLQLEIQEQLKKKEKERVSRFVDLDDDKAW